MKKIASIIGIIGLVLLLGTAGASDLGSISIMQTIARCAVGLGCMAISTLINECEYKK